MNTKRAQSLVLGLTAAIAALLGIKLWPRIAAEHVIVTLPPLVCAPPAQPCSRTLSDGGRIALAIAPTPIRPLQTLQLTVTLADTHADRVDVAFEGVHMPMGMAPVALAPGGSRVSPAANPYPRTPHAPDPPNAPDAPAAASHSAPDAPGFPDTPGASRFHGQAILPLCVTGAMRWSATVLLTHGRQTRAVPFHFDVTAHWAPQGSP